jgi:predicted PurR-regulated permease PerM
MPADGAPPEADVDAPAPRTAAAEARAASIRRSAARDPLVIPVTGIFVLMLIHALIFASEFLLPVTAAILGYFILNAPRRGLQRLGIGAPVTAALFTLLIGMVIAFASASLADPIYDFVTDIPTLLEQVMATLSGPGGMVEAVNEAAEATEEALAAAGEAPPMRVEVVSAGGLATSVAALAPGLLSQLVFALCLLFFLTASGDLFIQKAVQAADRFEDKRKTVSTIRRIEARLGDYLGAITLINAGLGVCIGVAMWIWGLPSPYLIGIMAALLNFIPFVGAVLGAAIAGLIAFVTFEDGILGLGVLGTYYALTAFEGQFVTPTLVGQRLRLNITMVFLSVAFFAWIWSAMGMIVAVPMLIVLKVICDSVPKLRKIGLFLGDAEGFVPGEMERGAELSGADDPR